MKKIDSVDYWSKNDFHFSFLSREVNFLGVKIYPIAINKSYLVIKVKMSSLSFLHYVTLFFS
jgi:hypothetical protein